MKAALSKGVADGTLVQVKSSYKLSKEAKKPPKAAAAKKAVAKKDAPKKKKVCRAPDSVPVFQSPFLPSYR